MICPCRLKITRQVSHVHQERLTIPKAHEFTPVFSGVRAARSLDFCVMFEDRSLFVRLFCFLIVLSVFLQFIASDYPFSIFKPYLRLRFKSKRFLFPRLFGKIKIQLLMEMFSTPCMSKMFSEYSNGIKCHIRSCRIFNTSRWIRVVS
jgi:hypothetical protein